MLGTTLSIQEIQSKDLSLDYCIKLLLEMGFKLIRIPAYWSRIESKKDIYDFKELDRIIKKLSDNNINIVLTIGVKSLRRPEFHIPDWLEWKNKGKYLPNSKYFEQKAFKYFQIVFERYKIYNSIKWWQVENEPFDNIPSLGSYKISESFLEKEIKYIRDNDHNNRKIITTTTFPIDILSRTIELFPSILKYRKQIYETGDIIGIDIYPLITYHFPFYKIRKLTTRFDWDNLLKFVKNQEKEIWITELQAEPWNSKILINKDIKTSNFELSNLISIYRKVRNLGFRNILFWGSEFWIQQHKYGHKEWINTIKNILKEWA